MAEPQPDWDAILADAGQRHGVDPDGLHAILQTESQGNPTAVGPKIPGTDDRAQGAFQFMPKTARALGIDPLQPDQAADGAARLLRENYDAFADPELAIAAYHGGTNPDNWGPKTRAYVEKVKGAYGSRLAARAAPDDETPDEPEAPVARMAARKPPQADSDDQRNQRYFNDALAREEQDQASQGTAPKTPAGWSPPAPMSQKPAAPEAAPAAPAIAARIKAARDAGYNDEEIASFLGQSEAYGPKIKAAEEAGYYPEEVFAHLGLNPTPGVRPVEGGQDELTAMGHSAAQGVTSGAGEVMGAASRLGERYLAPPLRRASEAATAHAGEFAQRQTELMDAIDRGEKAPGNTFLVPGYLDASPEERQALRAQHEKEVTAAMSGDESAAPQAENWFSHVMSPEEIEKWGQENYPIDPSRAGDLLVKTAKIVGGLPIYAAAGYAAGVPGVAGVAGLQSYEAMFRDAKAHGSSDDDAHEAATLSGLANAGLMAVPLHYAMKMIPDAFRGQVMTAILDGAKAGVALTGVTQLQTLIDNVVAGHTFDPNRPTTEGLGQGIPETFLAGAAGPAAAGAAGAATRAAAAAARRFRAAPEAGVPREPSAATATEPQQPAAPEPRAEGKPPEAVLPTGEEPQGESPPPPPAAPHFDAATGTYAVTDATGETHTGLAGIAEAEALAEQLNQRPLEPAAAEEAEEQPEEGGNGAESRFTPLKQLRFEADRLGVAYGEDTPPDELRDDIEAAREREAAPIRAAELDIDTTHIRKPADLVQAVRLADGVTDAHAALLDAAHDDAMLLHYAGDPDLTALAPSHEPDIPFDETPPRVAQAVSGDERRAPEAGVPGGGEAPAPGGVGRDHLPHEAAAPVAPEGPTVAEQRIAATSFSRFVRDRMGENWAVEYPGKTPPEGAVLITPQQYDALAAEHQAAVDAVAKRPQGAEESGPQAEETQAEIADATQRAAEHEPQVTRPPEPRLDERPQVAGVPEKTSERAATLDAYGKWVEQFNRWGQRPNSGAVRRALYEISPELQRAQAETQAAERAAAAAKTAPDVRTPGLDAAAESARKRERAMLADLRKQALDLTTGFTKKEVLAAQAKGEARAVRESEAADQASAPRKKAAGKKPTFVDRMENYFQPGRIVPSYGGRLDMVDRFARAQQGRWQVYVHGVDKAGNRVPGPDGRDRNHSTAPDRRPLEAWERDHPVGDASTQKAPEPHTPEAKSETPPPEDGAAFQRVVGTTSGKREELTAPFYSVLARAVEAGPAKAYPAAWKAYIKNAAAKGVKQAEVDWSGINDFIDQHKGALTKQEVLGQLHQNEVQVEEVMKGKLVPTAFRIEDAKGNFLGYADSREEAERNIEGEPGARIVPVVEDGAKGAPKFADYQLPGGKNYREMLLTSPHAVRDEVRPSEKAQARYASEWDSLSKTISEKTAEEREAHYSGKTTLSADLQREIGGLEAKRDALHERMVDDTIEENPRLTAAPFKSHHWDEPNVLAHIRMSDRTDAQGRKLLHVEEIQSDWHQTGRKYGYGKEPDVRPARVFAPDEMAVAQTEYQYEVTAPNGAIVKVGKGTVGSDAEAREYAARYLTENDSRRFNQEMALTSARRSVPDAPFKKNWHELALKRILRYAAENGYAGVSWTPGEEQAKRYDLSKKISRIDLHDNNSGGISRPEMAGPFKEGSLRAYDHDGKKVIERYVRSPEELPDLIGKEAAEKLLKVEPKATSVAGLGMRERSLSGLDLKVGGEGMKGFYDKIVPDFLNKYGKKWGAKVGTSEIGLAHKYGPYDVRENKDGQWDVRARDGTVDDTASTQQDAEHIARQLNESDATTKTVPLIDITPTMRKSVMEGQPLFARPDIHGVPAETAYGEVASVAARVNAIARHMAPGANVRSFERLSEDGTPIHGAYIPPRLSQAGHLIAWSLESPNHIGTVRHEAVHYLKRTGLITSEEWARLEQAAEAEDWLGRYKIKEAYPDLTHSQQIEEAVASHFAAWRRGEQAPGWLRPVYERVQRFLARVGGMARRVLGKDATPDDILSRVASGDVGQRTFDERGREAGRLEPAMQVPESESRATRNWVDQVRNLSDPKAILAHPATARLFGPDRGMMGEFLAMAERDPQGLPLAERALQLRRKMYSAIAEKAQIPDDDRLVGRIAHVEATTGLDPKQIWGRLNWEETGKALRGEDPAGYARDLLQIKRALAPGRAESLTPGRGAAAGAVDRGEPPGDVALQRKSPEQPETLPEGREYLDDVAEQFADHLKGLPPDTYARRLREMALPDGPAIEKGLNFIEKVTIFPRTLAALDTLSARLFNGWKARTATQNTILDDYRHRIPTFLKLSEAERRRIYGAEEQDRIFSIQRKPGEAVTVENTGATPYAEFTKKDDRYTLTPDEQKAYFERRQMFAQAWSHIMEGTARKLGWDGQWTGDMAQNINAIIERARTANHPSIKTQMQRIADLMVGMEQQRRDAYVPLMRFGNYYIAIKHKPGVDKTSLGGFPETQWFELVEPPALQEWRGAKSVQGQTPKIAEARIAELRQKFPASDFTVEHGYLFNKPDALRSLDIPAVEKLLMVMESNVKRGLKEKAAQAGETRAEAQGEWDRMYDTLLDTFRNEMYREMKAGFKKRSRTVPGYSNQWDRTTGAYMHWTSRHVADLLHHDEIERAYQDIQDRHPYAETKDYWKRWKRYQEDPATPLSRISQSASTLGFAYTLATNPASSAIMLLHGPIAGHATLAVGIGGVEAGKALYPALGEASTKMRADMTRGLHIDHTTLGNTPAEKALISRLHAEGQLHSVGADDLRALNDRQSDVWGTMKPMVRRAFDIASSNISVIDQVNRTGTALAAHRLASVPGNLKKIADAWRGDQIFRDMVNRDGLSPETVARFMVSEAALEWGKHNTAPIMRGAGQPFFLLHGFVTRMLSKGLKLLKNLGVPGRMAAVWLAAGVWATAGVEGYPFAQDIFENLPDKISQIFLKKDPMIAYRIRALLADAGFGKVGAEILMRGPASTLLGIDLASRVGFGDILTREFDSASIMAVAPAIIWGRLSATYQRYESGQSPWAVAAEALPPGLRNIGRAAAEATEGLKTVNKGKIRVGADDIPVADLVKQGVGFKPLAQERQRLHEDYRYRAMRSKMGAPPDAIP